jgi:MFS family permease
VVSRIQVGIGYSACFHGLYCVSCHVITSTLKVLTSCSTFTCISVVPIAGHIIADLNGGQESKTDSILLVTIWELGEAAGPLLIAPLSERYGRYPVFNIANVFFICGSVMGVLSQSVGLMIFSRFFIGMTVASNVLSPAIIGDIFPSEQRGSAMSVVMFAPLLGGAIGPAISGAITETLGWRRTMWLAILLSVICEVVFLTCFRETYKVKILAKEGLPITDDTEIAVSKADSSLIACITRPVKVFYSSFVLQILSLYGALAFTWFYVMATTFPDILRYQYNFTPAMIGTSFLSFSVGSVIGLIICNFLLDRIYTRLAASSEKPTPENRLPLMMVSSIALPFVVALYGWVPQLNLPVPLMLLVVVLFGIFVIMSMVPLMAYIVDAFNLFSASAITAILITRCLMGTFLPLVTAPLTDKIGYGLGFTVLSAACIVLAPIPFIVWKYGGHWRQNSEYTKDE